MSVSSTIKHIFKKICKIEFKVFSLVTTALDLIPKEVPLCAAARTQLENTSYGLKIKIRYQGVPVVTLLEKKVRPNTTHYLNNTVRQTEVRDDTKYCLFIGFSASTILSVCLSYTMRVAAWRRHIVQLLLSASICLS